MIRKLLNAIVCCAYLSGCVRYYVSDEKIKDFSALNASSHEGERSWDRYCGELAYQLHPERHYNPLPKAYTEYGKCLERGYGSTPSNQEQALKMFHAAAQCNEEEATKILRERSIAAPAFAGCTPGEFYFLCFEEQRCGLTQHITPLGYIVTAPITIPVGVVLAVGALLFLPLCAVVAPFTKGQCM